MELILDVNTQLYPMDIGERFTCAIARTLDERGTADDGLYNPLRKESLADKFEYVVYGKVYRCEDDSKASSKMFVFTFRNARLMM
jgi:DNA-directed RNA polymerase I, II, and III subunit RPABC3